MWHDGVGIEQTIKRLRLMLEIDLRLAIKKSLSGSWLMSCCQARGICYAISKVDLRTIPKERREWKSKVTWIVPGRIGYTQELRRGQYLIYHTLDVQVTCLP